MNDIAPAYLPQHINIFMCPSCGGTLNVSEKRCRIECSDCNTSFECDQGILLLFWQDLCNSQEDVTELVKSFNEDHPSQATKIYILDPASGRKQKRAVPFFFSPLGIAWILAGSSAIIYISTIEEEPCPTCSVFVSSQV